ncbi:RNA polymerase sigma factor [Ectothiorhodospiraceae bacterium 2226]|nr:RNA polymerase sigma factor [Ectothiorhodospiraceae bacterium 2226]
MGWLAHNVWKRNAHDHTFVTLMRPHLDYLYRMAYRFSGNAEDAEDLLQELTIKLFQRVDELRAVEQLRPWLTRALYRLFVDARRRVARSPHGYLVEPSESDDGLDALVGETASPEAETELWLTGQRLQAGLAALSDDHRALLVLHDVEGYTLTELVDLLETPLGTLKSRLHRARAQLRRHLEREPFARRERVSA